MRTEICKTYRGFLQLYSFIAVGSLVLFSLLIGRKQINNLRVIGTPQKIDVDASKLHIKLKHEEILNSAGKTPKDSHLLGNNSMKLDINLKDEEIPNPLQDPSAKTENHLESNTEAQTGVVEYPNETREDLITIRQDNVDDATIEAGQTVQEGAVAEEQSIPEQESSSKQLVPDDEVAEAQSVPGVESVEGQSVPEFELAAKQSIPEYESVAEKSVPEDDLTEIVPEDESAEQSVPEDTEDTEDTEATEATEAEDIEDIEDPENLEDLEDLEEPEDPVDPKDLEDPPVEDQADIAGDSVEEHSIPEDEDLVDAEDSEDAEDPPVEDQADIAEDSVEEHYIPKDDQAAGQSLPEGQPAPEHSVPEEEKAEEQVVSDEKTADDFPKEEPAVNQSVPEKETAVEESVKLASDVPLTKEVPAIDQPEIVDAMKSRQNAKNNAADNSGVSGRDKACPHGQLLIYPSRFTTNNTVSSTQKNLCGKIFRPLDFFDTGPARDLKADKEKQGFNYWENVAGLHQYTLDFKDGFRHNILFSPIRRCASEFVADALKDHITFSNVQPYYSSTPAPLVRVMTQQGLSAPRANSVISDLFGFQQGRQSTARSAKETFEYFTIIRDPVSRFISSTARAMVVSDSQFADVNKFREKCLKETVAETLQCSIEHVRGLFSKGVDKPEFIPSSIVLYRRAFNQNVSVRVFTLRQTDVVVGAIGTPPFNAMNDTSNIARRLSTSDEKGGSKESDVRSILSTMSLSDLTKGMRSEICTLYKIDALMMKSLGFKSTCAIFLEE